MSIQQKSYILSLIECALESKIMANNASWDTINAPYSNETINLGCMKTYKLDFLQSLCQSLIDSIAFYTSGLFFIIPCVDDYRVVDMRTVSFDVPPQEASFLV